MTLRIKWLPVTAPCRGRDLKLLVQRIGRNDASWRVLSTNHTTVKWHARGEGAAIFLALYSFGCCHSNGVPSLFLISYILPTRGDVTVASLIHVGQCCFSLLRCCSAKVFFFLAKTSSSYAFMFSIPLRGVSCFPLDCRNSLSVSLPCWSLSLCWKATVQAGLGCLWIYPENGKVTVLECGSPV